MKKIIVFLSCFCWVTVIYSQPLPDSVSAKYRVAKNDGQKGDCLLTYLSMRSLADSNTTANTLSLVGWFTKQNDQVGADYTNLWLSEYLIYKGDFAASLNILLPLLSRFEKRKDSYAIP